MRAMRLCRGWDEELARMARSYTEPAQWGHGVGFQTLPRCAVPAFDSRVMQDFA